MDLSNTEVSSIPPTEERLDETEEILPPQGFMYMDEQVAEVEEIHPGEVSVPLLEWDQLPRQAQLTILKCFSPLEQDYLRQICRSMRNLIDDKIGREMVVPQPGMKIRYYSQREDGSGDADWVCASNESVNSPVKLHVKIATPKKVNARIKSMTGTKIHTLELSTPSAYSQTQRFPFNKFIRKPEGVEKMKLCYVEQELVQEILGKCCNLKTLTYCSYTSGTDCPPTVMPTLPDRLRDGVINLELLTSLKLDWWNDCGNKRRVDTMNAITILLTVNAPSLKELDITNYVGDGRSTWCYILFPCLAHFISGASKQQLKRLIYNSESNCESPRSDEWPDDVMSLVTKYGNENTMQAVLEMCNDDGGNHFVMLTQPSGALKSLRFLTMRMTKAGELTTCIQLLGLLEAVEDAILETESGAEEWHGRLVNFLQSPEDLRSPICRTLKKLKLNFASRGRNWESSPTISLDRVLQKFSRLTSFKLETKYCGWKGYRLDMGRAVICPDVKFGGACFQPGVNFPHLETLTVRSGHVKTLGSKLIKRLPNLQHLSLEVGSQIDQSVKESYGVDMKTLLEILQMRKLEGVKVDNVILPEGGSGLTGNLRGLLSEVGKLEYDTCRYVECFRCDMLLLEGQ